MKQTIWREDGLILIWFQHLFGFSLAHPQPHPHAHPTSWWPLDCFFFLQKSKGNDWFWGQSPVWGVQKMAPKAPKIFRFFYKGNSTWPSSGGYWLAPGWLSVSPLGKWPRGMGRPRFEPRGDWLVIFPQKWLAGFFLNPDDRYKEVCFHPTRIVFSSNDLQGHACLSAGL